MDRRALLGLLLAAAALPAHAASPGAVPAALLLEASDSGSTGAVPWSGGVSWTTRPDDDGMPILVAVADFPGRLHVEMTIRRNTDRSLPAYALGEFAFTTGPKFAYKSVKSLAGLLAKNEQLVQGTALVGATARVTGNQFLFAFSDAPDDVTKNVGLLRGSRYLDLAIIYETDKRAIVTLELDPAAQALLDDTIGAWENPAPARPGGVRRR